MAYVGEDTRGRLVFKPTGRAIAVAVGLFSSFAYFISTDHITIQDQLSTDANA